MKIINADWNGRKITANWKKGTKCGRYTNVNISVRIKEKKDNKNDNDNTLVGQCAENGDINSNDDNSVAVQ